MPTYEYECQACGETTEALQSFSEKRLKKCPACGKNKLKRLIGAGAGIIFKGSGFYETDYKRKGEPKESDSAKDSGSGESDPSKSACSSCKVPDCSDREK